MKKINKFVFSFALIFILAMPMFAGCAFGNQKQISSLEVVGNLKKEYAVGEAFDPNGAKLKVNYDNNSSIEVDITQDMTDFDNVTLGKRELLITYQQKTAKILYRVDAIQLGIYEISNEYYDQNGNLVDTNQTNKICVFSKTNESIIMSGTQGDPDFSLLEFTWDYKQADSDKINLTKKDTAEITELTIVSTTKLEYITNSSGTSPNGHSFANCKFVLTYRQ